MSERRGSNPSEVTDDSISITSTVDSEKQDEYVVEAIIAERENDGERQYLVRWEGYPDERCTWEPRSSFQNENTLLDWEAQKSRVSRGLAEPCNVEALLDRVEEWILSTNRRKLRRRAKRLRLGLAETAMETRIDEDDSYDEAEPSPMEAEHGLESPVRANALKSKGDSASEGRIRTGPKGKQPSSNRSIAPVGKSAGVWSEEEELALVEGLDLLKGPYFDQILDLYGPAGTVNQILKERTVVELQEKTRNLYEEFQEQGFEIPSNMHDVPGAETTETSSIQVPGKAPTAVMFLPQKRDNGAGGSKSTSASSNASPTKVSFGEAGKAPQRDRASGLPKENLGPAKSSPTQSEVGMSRRPSLSAYDSPGARPASKLSSASSPKPAVAVLRRTSQADPPARRKEPRDSNDPNPLSPRIENSRRASLPEQSSKPTATASKPPKRSGKTNLKEGSSRTRQLQMGSSGRGPARLDLSKRKYSTTVSKNVRVSGDAILRNWNKDLKGRKLKAIRPRINDKPAQKFSIMRRYVKAGRNEPAPNIEKLTFLNLKHGNVTKQPPLATPKPSPPTKTPFQLIQEGLKPSDDAPVGIESTDAPPLREQNLDSSISQRTTLDRGAEQTAKSEVSGSESKRTNTIVASPVDSPTDLAPNPHKRSLPDPQIQRESNPTTAQAEVCRSLEHLGHSEAMPASDNQLVPRGTRHDEGLFDADSSPYTSAPSREKSASTAQPGSGFKSTSSSRPHADIQTTPTSYYSTMTQIQRDRPTPAQEELMKKSRAEHDILGNIFVGHDSKDLGSVRFRGLDWHTKQLFLTIKVPPRQMHVRCGYICTVGEYQEFYRGERNDYIRGGYVVPFFNTFGPISEMAEILKSQASGAIAYAEKFSVLIYPTNSGLESWDFLNELQPRVPEGTLLRFVIRKPLPPPEPAEVDLTGSEKLLLLTDGESNISTVFRHVLGIEYERLIKQPTPEKTAESNNFFLFFIGVEKEFFLMCRFLSAHGAKIYSWDDEGAWEYFCNHVEAGVILIEGSFYQLYLIPNLSRLLRKQINVFNITFNADELAPHPHINRLFPHGQAILITDSFLLFHPQEAARFLRWFHLQVLVTKPAGTWKLCVRPGIRDFLLAIIEEKSEEDGFVFMQMYESLYYIIPEDTVDDEDLEDDIELDTDLQEKPVRCMSSGVSNFDQSVGKNMAPRELLNEDRVSKNDAILVEWFAGWAMTQLESFRRFHIISGARSGRREAEKMEWEGKWSHIDVMSPQTAFDKHKIPAWERDFEQKKMKEKKTKGTRRGSNGDKPPLEKVSPTG